MVYLSSRVYFLKIVFPYNIVKTQRKAAFIIIKLHFPVPALDFLSKKHVTIDQGLDFLDFS